MIPEKITNAVAMLGEVPGRIPPDAWDVVNCARRELLDAAQQAEAGESCLTNEMIAGFAEKGKASNG